MDIVTYFGMALAVYVAVAALIVAFVKRKAWTIVPAILMVAFAAQCIGGNVKYARYMTSIDFRPHFTEGDLVGTWRASNGRVMTLEADGSCTGSGVDCGRWAAGSRRTDSINIDGRPCPVFERVGRLHILHWSGMGGSDLDDRFNDPDHWQIYQAFMKADE